jgi:hypothetical protein
MHRFPVSVSKHLCELRLLPYAYAAIGPCEATVKASLYKFQSIYNMNFQLQVQRPSIALESPMYPPLVQNLAFARSS